MKYLSFWILLSPQKNYDTDMKPKKDKKLELDTTDTKPSSPVKKPNTEKPKKKVNPIQIEDDVHALVKALEAKGFDDFIQYLRSPWRIVWSNLLAGIFRGLGILIGMTMIIGLIAWILSQLINFPVIGEYFRIIFEGIKSFIPQDMLLQLENVQNKPDIY